jgi:hypothetical protein
VAGRSTTDLARRRHVDVEVTEVREVGRAMWFHVDAGLSATEEL